MIIDCAHYQDGRRQDEGAVGLEEAAARCRRGGFVWLGLFEPATDEPGVTARPLRRRPPITSAQDGSCRRSFRRRSSIAVQPRSGNNRSYGGADDRDPSEQQVPCRADPAGGGENS